MHVVLIVDAKKQRFALMQALQAFFDAINQDFLLHFCGTKSDFLQKDAADIKKGAVWLIDTDDFDEKTERMVAAFLPKKMLVGFSRAPDYQNKALYDKWQRKLIKKFYALFDDGTLTHKKKSKANKQRPWRYVLFLGASMGGVHAVKQFLDNLLPHLPIAVLIAHHFDENMLENLPAILTRQNRWRCKLITSTQSLQAGLCLLAPVDKKIICDSTGRIMLSKTHWQGGYRPNIGELLKNASEVYGAQLIGIILSGMGDDGSQNGKSIVKNFSCFWAQDPKSADSPSQPQAFIDTGVCQFIGTPFALSDRLNQMFGYQSHQS